MICCVNYLFKINIIDIEKIAHSRYLDVELKTSVISFRFSFAIDLVKNLSQSKKETDQQQGDTIERHD